MIKNGIFQLKTALLKLRFNKSVEQSDFCRNDNNLEPLNDHFSNSKSKGYFECS